MWAWSEIVSKKQDYEHETRDCEHETRDCEHERRDCEQNSMLLTWDARLWAWGARLWARDEIVSNYCQFCSQSRVSCSQSCASCSQSRLALSETRRDETRRDCEHEIVSKRRDYELEQRPSLKNSSVSGSPKRLCSTYPWYSRFELQYVDLIVIYQAQDFISCLMR